MIAVIEIPHQRPAQLHWYTDREAVLDYAIDYADETDRPEPEDFVEAVATLADDWNGRVVVENLADVDNVSGYTGHQALRVNAMADELREEFAEVTAS